MSSKNKFSLKKLFTVIAYTLISLIVVYNATLIFKSVINRDATPSFFGIKSFVVVSGSMEPNIEIGDYIFVKSVDTEDIKVGDVISFRSGNSVVTHRVEEIINDNGEIKYKTKGDSNNIEDKELVPSSSVEGLYIRKISKLGKVILALNNKLVLIVVLILLYLIIKRGFKNDEKTIKETKIIEKKEKKNSRNKMVVLVYFLLISTVLLTTFSLAKYKSTYSTEKTARVAKWEVHVDTSNNDTDTFETVIGNDNVNYILEITSLSEVETSYSIEISNVPDNVEIKLDDGSYILPTNNEVTFNNVGFINADAQLEDRTITHILNFNVPIDTDTIDEQEININVFFNQND